jgi:hypothetical protein
MHYLLEQRKSNTGFMSEQIVSDILNDFTDRRGLRQEWDNIEDDIKEEIICAWIEIVDRNLKKSCLQNN